MPPPLTHTQDYFASATVTIIQDGGWVNPACVAGEGKDHHRCWDAMVAQKYLHTPMFLAQNMFDENQIHDELLCPPGVCKVGTGSTTGRAFLADYAKKAVASVHEVLAQHPTWGAFVPGCLQHTDDVCMSEGPTIHGHSYAEALAAWFFHPTARAAGSPTVLFDNCTAAGWLPCNDRCTGFQCQDS